MEGIKREYTSDERSPIIDPELRDLLPPITDEEREALTADILKNVPVHEEPAADLIGDEEDEDVRRCEYVSEDGIQCRNQARPGSRFCGVHDTDAFDDAEDLI